MHVDAFFEYLLGKGHTYFMDLPHPDDPLPAQGRDGVPAEEDLAIRALDPSFRPKRGRKRNESPDQSPAPPKRPLLTTSFTFEGQTLYAQPQSAHPVSAIPLSARPENYNDPWAAASAVTPDSFGSRHSIPQSAMSSRSAQPLQWQLHGSHETPITPHPMSAIEPRATSLASIIASEEPRSAVTPTSQSRSRRKHGPAVSSAWPSSNPSTSTKLRGRPPGNRNVQDGPYSTFPVDPNADKSPSQRSTPTIALVPSPEIRAPLIHANTYTSPTENQQSSTPDTRPLQARPERLSLQVQVPQHTGGPVRLVTPTVLVNGESNANTSSTSSSTHASPGAPTAQMLTPTQAPTKPSSPPGFAYEALKRILATDLLRANLSGRPNRLSPPQSLRLAHAILSRFGLPEQDSDSNTHDALRISASSWLGLSSQLGFSAGSPCREKDILIQRHYISADGSETLLAADETAPPGATLKEKFDVTWSLGFGGAGGRFAVTSVELEEEVVDLLDPETRAHELCRGVREAEAKGDGEVDYKAKFMALDLSVRLMKGQLQRLQGRVLDAVL